MRTAVAYIRVSTDMQTEYSPDSQLKLIKDYASKNNFILSEIYSDEGISGRKADKRPAFKRMIADARKKYFDAILIYNTSRFARNHEESIVYRNMLQREGVEVISITQPSVDYKTDILMNPLYAVMDERYSIELSENVKRGMKEKVSRGIYISCAPLGYKRIESNKPLKIDENESKLIHWIFDEYINGKAMFAIAKELNAKGHKAKRGKPFDRRGIYRILSNPIYKGFVSWTCDGEEIYTKADHMPIIDEFRFEKVSRMLEENIHRKAYKSRDVSICAHWLVGVIRCPTCGTTYVFMKGYKGRSNRFRCGNYSNASCINKHSIKVSDIENLVLDYLRNITFLDLEVSKKVALNNNNLDGNLHTTLSQLEKALERAKQAFLHGIDTMEEYKKNKDNITTEMDNIKNMILGQQQANKTKDDMVEKLRTLVDMLESENDNKSKNTMLRNIVSKIIIDTHTKRLSFYFFS